LSLLHCWVVKLLSLPYWAKAVTPPGAPYKGKKWRFLSSHAARSEGD
jgi:hypothetical protein